MPRTILDRAKVHDKKAMTMPDGDAEETRFPRANPGQLPYHLPRMPGPTVPTNSGKK